jgi:glycosyltransferase involved in cell wall biosynthesis
MTTLRVIIDDIVAGGTGRLARYAEDLTRALIRTAPRGTDVAGFVSASPEGDYALLRERLPGLRELHKSALARRELAAAWQHGFTLLPGSGMVHSTSLLAPLRKHDRSSGGNDQSVVTIHDAIAWTHPDLLSTRQVAWTKGMAKRADRYADAVVVPSHAVADELAGILNLGDRVRVIGGAPSSSLEVPFDAAARRARLGLTTRYVVATVEGDPRNGFASLAGAAASSALDGTPVVVLAAAGDAAHIEDGDRLTVLDDLSEVDRAAVLAGAAVYVQPSVAAGFGAGMLDAMSLGVPVIATDVPALVETAADAARFVPRDDSRALAEAIAELLSDKTAADQLGVAAGDRAKAFTWRDAAEKVWQLHADL